MVMCIEAKSVPRRESKFSMHNVQHKIEVHQVQLKLMNLRLLPTGQKKTAPVGLSAKTLAAISAINRVPKVFSNGTIWRNQRELFRAARPHRTARRLIENP